MEEDKKKLRIRLYVKILFFFLLTVVLAWFSWTVYEYNRVLNDKRPILCYKEIKDVEDDDEYSIMCYGLLYKYKEYYYTDTDEMSAREFTFFFKDFERKSK